MKNIISQTTAFLLLISILGCNKTIEVTPIEKEAVTILQPDYNFIATSVYDIIYPDNNFRYKMPIELYVRPFENVNDNTNFVLEFSSSKYSSFVVNNDTLYSGDKIKLQYKQFKNFRLFGAYYSLISGTHNLDFKLISEKVSKPYQIVIIAK